MQPVLACLAGVAIGLHFNVLIMIPLTLTATILAISYILLSGQPFFVSIGYFLALVVVHHAGYITGLTGRDLYSSMRHRLVHGQTERV